MFLKCFWEGWYIEEERENWEGNRREVFSTNRRNEERRDNIKWFVKLVKGWEKKRGSN